MKLNGTRQLLVYANDVNILGGCIHTVKKNTDTLVVATKKNGLYINADKTKYMVMSWDQNAGKSNNRKTDHSSYERVEGFKYSRKTLTNQNSIQEEIKSKLRVGNACYHSVQILLSSSLLTKSIIINKIYRTIILLVVLYGCETWLLALRKEFSQKVLEKRVLRKIFGPKRDKVTGEWRKFNDL